MIKVGDEVTWTHVSTRGRVLNMTLREGAVERVSEGVAVVRKPRGRCESVAIWRLRSHGEKSQITEFVEVVFGREVQDAI